MLRRTFGRTAGLLAAGLLLAWSAAVSEVRLNELLAPQGFQNAKDIAAGFATPDLSREFLIRVARLSLESLAIASLGLLLAMLLAIPLAVAAARLPTLMDAPAPRTLIDGSSVLLRGTARAVLILLRSVPEIIWAFLFVRMLGLGPGPGVLAIGFTFAGVIGRLYAELLESVDPGPVRALRVSGVSGLGVLIFGVLPQVRNQWIGYGLFRYECAIRSAAVLGVVGAGGLGSEIQLAVRYFEFDKLATTLAALVSIIALLEVASAWLRRRPAKWSVGLLVGSAAGSLACSSIDFAALFEPENIALAGDFLSGFANPTWDAGFWRATLVLVVETIGIAFFGTALAAMLAFVLAPLAARTLTVRGFLAEPPGRRGLGDWIAFACFVAARLVLQLGRALPDIVWALIFVVWVGPGPFAGTLAIAAHTTGLLGRLFGEVYEDLEPTLPAALEASGARRIGVWGYGVLPQVAARLAAFGLFRFEVSLRVTAMIGFVGAGGLGDAIHTAISLFHGRQLASLLIALLALVVVVDFLSGTVRRRLLDGWRAVYPRDRWLPNPAEG